jgi:hypothetical protein
MNILNKQMPFAPADWTWGQSIRHLVKLGLFITVPGLHQFASNRKLLGTFLFGLFAVSSFIFTNHPTTHTSVSLLHYQLYFGAMQFAFIASWILIAVDQKNLQRRPLKPGFIFPVALMYFLHVLPLNLTGTMAIFVQPNDFACPEICQGDIIEYQPVGMQKPSLIQGEEVVIYKFNTPPYVSRFLAGPAREACANDKRTPLNLPVDNAYCDYSGGDYMYEYLVFGGQGSQLEHPGDMEISMISGQHLEGIKPRVIGSTRKYFVLNDGITDFVGNALLTLFTWSSIDLLGLKETNFSGEPRYFWLEWD